MDGNLGAPGGGRGRLPRGPDPDGSAVSARRIPFLRIGVPALEIVAINQISPDGSSSSPGGSSPSTPHWSTRGWSWSTGRRLGPLHPEPYHGTEDVRWQNLMGGDRPGDPRGNQEEAEGRGGFLIPTSSARYSSHPVFQPVHVTPRLRRSDVLADDHLGPGRSWSSSPCRSSASANRKFLEYLKESQPPNPFSSHFTSWESCPAHWLLAVRLFGNLMSHEEGHRYPPGR